jgi:hypothetical protein
MVPRIVGKKKLYLHESCALMYDNCLSPLNKFGESEVNTIDDDEEEEEEDDQDLNGFESSSRKAIDEIEQLDKQLEELSTEFGISRISKQQSHQLKNSRRKSNGYSLSDLFNNEDFIAGNSALLHEKPNKEEMSRRAHRRTSTEKSPSNKEKNNEDEMDADSETELGRRIANDKSMQIIVEADKVLSEWSCIACTFINKGRSTKCELCQATRQQQELPDYETKSIELSTNNNSNTNTNTNISSSSIRTNSNSYQRQRSITPSHSLDKSLTTQAKPNSQVEDYTSF